MNYKLLFPSYRNRYLFIKDQLQKRGGHQTFRQALNLGTGEGDYDEMIAAYCQHLTACDINQEDIDFARALNQHVPNLKYQVENALDLSFPDNTFDLIISVDVIEHVGHPEQMLTEIQRVLKPGGLAFITFPSQDFPITYDPVNKLFGKRVIAQGAYAFGHEYLISPKAFSKWSADRTLKVIQDKNLSGYLIALLEMYWTGWIQSIFKANSSNLSGKEEKKMVIRPSSKESILSRFGDTSCAMKSRHV